MLYLFSSDKVLSQLRKTAENARRAIMQMLSLTVDIGCEMNAFVPCDSSDLRSLLIYPPFYLWRLCGLNRLASECHQKSS